MQKSQTLVDCYYKKIQEFNSELSHMKHSQEVSKSDLQAVKIQLGHFLGMFHV